LVEVTCRALHSRLLFRPGLDLNEIIIGALARAKRRYGARVCFFVCVSNHLHLLRSTTPGNSPASWGTSARSWRGRSGG
jgi:hypothetical protein